MAAGACCGSRTSAATRARPARCRRSPTSRQSRGTTSSGCCSLSLDGPVALPRSADAVKQASPPGLLPLRFVGDGRSIDGPGNFAIDGDGNVYVANNYVYGADPLIPRCGSDLLPVFGPDGRYAAEQPLPRRRPQRRRLRHHARPGGNVWVGNFGFAAPAPECPERPQPPHNSVSVFTPEGRCLADDTGVAAGDICLAAGHRLRPEGNIWVANCGDGKVVAARRPATRSGRRARRRADGGVRHRDRRLGHRLRDRPGQQQAGDPQPRRHRGRRSTIAAQLGLRPTDGHRLRQQRQHVDRQLGVPSTCPARTAEPTPATSADRSSLLGRRQTGHAGRHAFTGGGLDDPVGHRGRRRRQRVGRELRRASAISEFCGMARRNCRPAPRPATRSRRMAPATRFDGFTRLTAVADRPVRQRLGDQQLEADPDSRPTRAATRSSSARRGGAAEHAADRPAGAADAPVRRRRQAGGRRAVRRCRRASRSSHSPPTRVIQPIASPSGSGVTR